MNVWLIRAGRMAAALGVWLLLGGWIGIVLGVATYAVAGRLLRRVESPARRREREQIRADLPYAADLLAATVRAGMPTDLALRTVGTALAGPLGRRFVQVADGLRIGLEPGDAWSVLRAGSESARLVEAVLRSADSGAAIARSVERVADATRAAAVARMESASSRLGVLLVLPLGLCFLPAFVFAGIVPVIAAELGGVLR